MCIRDSNYSPRQARKKRRIVPEINILDSYSWNILPSFIKIEHAHIDDIYARSLLEARGYVVYTELSDMYAIR